MCGDRGTPCGESPRPHLPFNENYVKKRKNAKKHVKTPDIGYAPVKWETPLTITEKMKTLAKSLLGNNTAECGEGTDGKGEVYSIVKVHCRPAEGGDVMVTEKTHGELFA